MVAPKFLDRELKLALRQDMGPEAMARELAAFSRQNLADYLQTLRIAPGWETFVNGRRGLSEDQVKAPGPVVYLFSYWPEVLNFALAFLRGRSPTGPAEGKPYKESFFVMAGGREKHPRQWSTIAPDEEVTITNSAPYSRKLDVGLMGAKPIKLSVPPGIMEAGAAAIRSQYGGLLEAKRVYNVPHTGQWIYRRGRRAGKAVNSPGIILTPKA
jgi:hypothetical protein